MQSRVEQSSESGLCCPHCSTARIFLSWQLVGNIEPSYPGESARTRYANASAPTPGDVPRQQRQKHPPKHFATGTGAAARRLHAAHHRFLVPINPQPERTFRSLPPGLGRPAGEEVGSKPKLPPRQRPRRWIATPAEGTEADLSRLENAQTPLLLQQRAGNLCGLYGSASMGALADSHGRGEERERLEAAGRARVDMSPRIERTVRRLSAMEECLRSLEASMKELQQAGKTPFEIFDPKVKPAEGGCRRDRGTPSATCDVFKHDAFCRHSFSCTLVQKTYVRSSIDQPN